MPDTQGTNGPSDHQRSPELPEFRWLNPDENPWGVRVLDVRPATLQLLSTSSDPQCAANAVSFGAEDGARFVGADLPVDRSAPVGLRYRIDQAIGDGVLFTPRVMEHKWALFYRQQQIFCVRSWTRLVHAVADVDVHEDFIWIYRIRGTLVGEDDPSFSMRTLDFLLRSHPLDMNWPAALPPDVASDPHTAALWCFHWFGNRVQFATDAPVPYDVPEQPLRTYQARGRQNAP